MRILVRSRSVGGRALPAGGVYKRAAPVLVELNSILVFGRNYTYRAKLGPMRVYSFMDI
jgi:hypothetical protein